MLSLVACTPITVMLKREKILITESVKQGLASGAKVSMGVAEQASLP